MKFVLYTQPDNLYRLMSDDEKHALITNIVNAMSGIDGPKRELIINRQLCHWFRADIGLGMAVAKGLQVNTNDAMKSMAEHVNSR
ncbi:MAG TPA: catalase-related domain-containing protein [Mucilaginibacter sp.]